MRQRSPSCPSLEKLSLKDKNLSCPSLEKLSLPEGLNKSPEPSAPPERPLPENPHLKSENKEQEVLLAQKEENQEEEPWDLLPPEEEEALGDAAAHYHDNDNGWLFFQRALATVTEPAHSRTEKIEEELAEIKRELKRLNCSEKLGEEVVEMKEGLIGIKEELLRLASKPKNCELMSPPEEKTIKLQSRCPTPSSGRGTPQEPSILKVEKPDEREPHPLRVPPPENKELSWGPSKLGLNSPLQQTLQRAAEKNEDTGGFHMAFPILERPDGQGQIQRYHSPIPFKQLKELKVPCSQYGPTAPFTEALLDSLATDALPPNDWKNMARACLGGGDYLLWKSEFIEQCQATAEINRGQNIPFTFEMLAGEGPYGGLNDQLQYPPGAYAQVNAAATKAWRKLPSTGRQTEDLSKIRQGPDEPFQDFVSRLLQTAGWLIGDGESGMLLVKQLAFENANTACQAAIRPFRKKGNLSDYIRLCSDIGPSYVQGLTIAAAL
ncbi:hypothetical protein QTO34_008509 [Cnephaeus nilssonii]|uniref:Retroviral nucleocapsid Gag protein p24 C-terminal domain-containing protein n=1 Tax=Cnephaeus nilssonii TaxID=3371016 RepID=A0AA40IBK1_CNENI|nr:hypothetical protein QTO34_008509 [Eptesicus nilssonii]